MFPVWLKGNPENAVASTTSWFHLRMVQHRAVKICETLRDDVSEMRIATLGKHG